MFRVVALIALGWLLAAGPARAEETLVLKDGREVVVIRLTRRKGVVFFQTGKGERFSVPEDQVASPKLEEIPLFDEPSPTPSLAIPEPLTVEAVSPAPEIDVPATLERVEPPEPGSPDPEEFIPLPNRWRSQRPGGEQPEAPTPESWIQGNPLDPYNQSRFKGDSPVKGQDLFSVLNLQSLSVFNPRQVAVSRDEAEPEPQFFYNQNIVVGAEVFRGATVFQPKLWAVRATAVVNFNYLAQGSLSLAAAERGPTVVALEEGFYERRLLVLNRRFDFLSLRIGMQPFTSDFRGYLFSENQLGARLFGNAHGNRSQYNLAIFSMRERDEVSQLHGLSSGEQRVFIANYYFQDFLAPGYTLMGSYHHNRDGGLGAHYLGWHGDGRFRSWNVSHAFYQALGREGFNRFARRSVALNAQLAALEVSRDSDWARYRLSVFYASPDRELDDDRATGFDMISDNPNFAGGQFMFWIQQKTTVPGLATLSDKFSLLPNLRSKFRERSNFVNPGLWLLNTGFDLRVTAKLKTTTNLSYLRLADAAVLRELLNDGGIDEEIGLDASFGAKYRPLLNENFTVVAGGSFLLPSGGLSQLLERSAPLFSVFAAVALAY